jgi:hypothetical protein
VYDTCSDYVGFLELGESATRSLVRASRGSSAFYYQVEYVNGFYDGSKHSIYFNAHSHPHMTTHIRICMDIGSSSDRTEHSSGGQS